jgi:hypothetical protein
MLAPVRGGDESTWNPGELIDMTVFSFATPT